MRKHIYYIYTTLLFIIVFVARFFIDLIVNQQFDILIMMCVFFDMLYMCLEHHNHNETYDRILGYIDNFFIAM